MDRFSALRWIQRKNVCKILNFLAKKPFNAIQLKLIIVSIIKWTMCSCSMVSISKLPQMYSKKMMFKATVAKNLCQALGTGLFRMIVPAEKLHFYRLWGTSMYSKVLECNPTSPFEYSLVWGAGAQKNHTRYCYICGVHRYSQGLRERGGSMEQITIKTPNTKCRPFWCFIEFIDWRYSQWCWYFRALLWTSASLTFSAVDLPPPPFPVWISTGVCI